MIKKTSRSPDKISRPPLARMLHLHAKLARGTYPNCQAEARELEVSYKTILRDLDFMRDQLGLPIEYDSHKYGYHYTEPVTHFPTMQVSEGELVALFIAQKAMEQYRGTSFEEPLRNAFRKLTEGLKDRVDFQIDSLDENFSFRTTGTPVSDLKMFENLGKAILHSYEIHFEYRKLKERDYEDRSVQPYHLACVDNQWYLFAHDLERDQIRTFALPRMRRLRLTEKKFKRPADFSPAQLLSGSFGVFTGTAQHKILIRFDTFAAQLIREKSWHPSQKITEHNDGSLELEMTLASLHEVERWILSWRQHATVLGPPELKENICQSIRTMLTNYQNPTNDT